jgi:CHAD domain-containing protein
MKAKTGSNFGKDLQRHFSHHAHKKGKKLKEALQIIVRQQTPEAVHDFRKITRDLQCIIAVCGIRRASRKVKQIRNGLRGYRHALSDWRDSDVLLSLIKQTQRKATDNRNRADWTIIADGITKRRQTAIKAFLKKANTHKVKQLVAKITQIVKKSVTSEPIMDNLAQLLQQAWKKWNAAMDAFDSDPTVSNLHNVRIKAKTLRYAANLREQFYTYPQLEHAGSWLKDIQDQIGAWHDELSLSQLARSTFVKTPREPHATKLIRTIKEQEIIMAETAQKFLRSLRHTKDYERLRLALSASIFAMASDSQAKPTPEDDITGTPSLKRAGWRAMSNMLRLVPAGGVQAPIPRRCT